MIPLRFDPSFGVVQPDRRGALAVTGRSFAGFFSGRGAGLIDFGDLAALALASGGFGFALGFGRGADPPNGEAASCA